MANTAKLRSIGQIPVATSGTEISYPSGAPEIIPVSSEVHVALSLVFCVVFCGSLFLRGTNNGSDILDINNPGKY
jgi:hypothetical protein